MGKYNKRICEVDAFRWNGDQSQTEVPDWFSEAIESGDIWFHSVGTPECTMLINAETKCMSPLENCIYSAKIGDFIIRESNGLIHPYKPFAFVKDYVPVM